VPKKNGPGRERTKKTKIQHAQKDVRFYHLLPEGGGGLGQDMPNLIMGLIWQGLGKRQTRQRVNSLEGEGKGKEGDGEGRRGRVRE